MNTSIKESNPRIAFIGGGNMAHSLVGGLIRDGAPPSNIVVSEPNDDLRAQLQKDFSVATNADNVAAANGAATLVLAVKPQVMKSVCEGLRDTVTHGHPVVISIAAGIRIDQMNMWLGGNAAIVRCMPNTPALIGAGATAMCANAAVNANQRSRAEKILSSAGVVRWIDDENLMDTVTALSGSGPAYFFLLVEALEEAAVAQGLSRETARELATQTCLGAGMMLRDGNVAPAELRKRVTSPNGTTQAALESFASDQFNAIVARAVAAATRRGVELSAQMDAT